MGIPDHLKAVSKQLARGISVLLWPLAAATLGAQEHAAPKERIPPADLPEAEAQAVELYRKVLPAVVTIYTSQRTYAGDGLQLQEGVASGVLISSNGQELVLGGDLILTLGTQDACHQECLVRAGQQLGGLDRIPVEFLRGGQSLRTVVDVSSTRRNFLQGSQPEANP